MPRKLLYTLFLLFLYRPIWTQPCPFPTRITSDTTVCHDKPFTLHASGGVSYSWTSSDPAFSATGSSITETLTTNTEFYVKITDAGGCTVVGSVAVTVRQAGEFKVDPFPPPAICAGDTLRFVLSGADRYSWRTNDGQLLTDSPSILYAPSESTLLWGYLSDDVCDVGAGLGIRITVHPPPTLSISSSNPIGCGSDQTTLTVSGALNYQWLAGPGIADLSSSHPVVNPSQTTTYYVKGTDANHCSALDSITVKVDNTETLTRYPVPSAFSPNDDGNNDCFGLKHWGDIISLEMEVFDRWGKRVFYTTDPQQCWDGKCNGVPQPTGGYVYQIKAATACGTAYRKGIVMLVR